MKLEGTTGTMAVKKRKREALDDSELFSLENDLPSLEREKVDLMPVNGEASSSKKKRLGQKGRRKALKTLGVGPDPSVGQDGDQVDLLKIKPVGLSKGVQLVDINRKRKLESGVTDPEPQKVQVDNDNYAAVSDRPTMDRTRPRSTVHGHEPTVDSPNCRDEEDEKLSAIEEQPTFDAKRFRKLLRGGRPKRIQAFKLFVEQLSRPVVATEEPKVDVAAEYMAAGGSALEILEVLDSNDRENFTHANLVFKALQVLIMRGLTDSPAFKSSCEEACYQLAAYVPTMQHMLSENGGNQERKSVLKLLTAVVSMSSMFAKFILSNVKFSPPVLTLVTRVQPGEKQDPVRTSFIHFLMAFLVDINSPLISELVVKSPHELITSTFFGLKYDEAATVHMVLTTLRTNVVENKLITKTQKYHLFNRKAMHTLINLYNWRGPRATTKGQGDKLAWLEVDAADPEDKKLVADALHQLLLVLCTNHKLGLVFLSNRLLKRDGESNKLMWNILQDLRKPWESAHLRDLVVNILATCPELVYGVLSTVVVFLEPRQVASAFWLQVVSFVKQVVEGMDPDRCLKSYYKAMSFDQLEIIVLNLCAPIKVLEVVKTEMLQHKDIIVCHAAFDLVKSMVTQTIKYFETLDKWEVFDKIGRRDKFRKSITKYFPTTVLLLQAWEKIGSFPIPTNVRLNCPTVTTFTSLMLDLLLLYHRLDPARFLAEIAVSNQTLNLGKLLADMKKMGVVGQEGGDQIQVKAVELVTNMDVFDFRNEKETLSETLHLLLRVLGTDRSPATSSAYTVLTSILTSSHLFDRSPDEVNIWLHCYWTLREVERANVAQMLVKALVGVITEPEMYEAMVKETEENAGAEGEVDSTSQSQHISTLLSSVVVEISKSKSKQLKNFFSRVVVHMFHSQQSPTFISHLLKMKCLDSSIFKYIQSWSDPKSKPTPIPLGRTFDCDSLEYKISNAIMRREDDCMADILGLGETVDDESEISKDVEPIIHSDRDVAVCSVIKRAVEDPLYQKLLFNLTLSIFTRLTSRKEITEASISKCSATLKALLTHTKQPYKYFQAFFEHPVVIETFSSFYGEKGGEGLSMTLISELIRLAMTKYSSEVSVNVLQPYKNKFVEFVINNINKSTDSGKCHEGCEDLLDIVKIFKLEFDYVLKLIKKLSLASVKVKVLMVSTEEGPTCLSVWGSLLTYLLRRVTIMRATDRTKSYALPQNVVTQISKHLIELYSYETLDFEMLEEAFVMYLKQFSHNVADVPSQLFKSIIVSKAEYVPESRVELGVLLLTRQTHNLGKMFSTVLQSNQLVEKSQLVFPFLSVLFDDIKNFHKSVVKTIYERYEPDIVKSICKPNKVVPWIVNNTTVIVTLIKSCTSFELCKELCTSIQKNVGKYTYSEYHIHLIESVFMKANSSGEEEVKPIITLTEVLLKLLTDTASKDKANMALLCNLVRKNVGEVIEESMWETIKVAPVWLQFTKQALKLGLQSEQKEYDSGLLLHTLSDLCKVMYKDGGNDEEISTLFEMTMSHSEFLTVMLGSTPTKLALVQLLTTFVGKNTTIMSSKHIPILLGSYDASLSRTDQLLLKLLRTYEENNVSLSECRPYLWGEAAVNYFCVKTNEPLTLWRHPNMMQVINLLKYSQIEETVTCFPLHRKLNLEEYEDMPSLYDPAFLLPLFSHLLVPESLVKFFKFVQSGCLALTLASLASSSMALRAAAYHVLTRFYHHLDTMRKKPDERLWLHFMDVIKNGICNLGKEGTGPQLPCIVSTFLARTSMVLSISLDPMFERLSHFICAKPAMNLNTIPELYVLIHSTDVASLTHRHWILTVIRDGLRSVADWQLCFSYMLFKLLWVFYSSVIGSKDKESKVLILQITNSAIQLPGLARLLVTANGLFPWLHQTVRNLQSSDNDLINVVIQIITSLSTSEKKFSKNKDKQSQTEVIRSQLISNLSSFDLNISLLVLSLLPKLPPSMTVGELKKYLAIFKVITASHHNVITYKHLKSLVLFCKGVLGKVDDCEDFLVFGCIYALKSYRQNVLEDDIEDAKNCLRQILMKMSYFIKKERKKRREMNKENGK